MFRWQTFVTFLFKKKENTKSRAQSVRDVEVNRKKVRLELEEAIRDLSKARAVRHKNATH